MLIIKTDDGNVFKFENKEYTKYEIIDDFIVVKLDEQWIGCFSKNHFISLVIK